MHYVVLATDYDGTVAHDGVVDEPTLAALERLRAASRRLILVTGRELPDLQRVMPRLDLFDFVVVENGALLYRPETREEQPLVEPPPPRFVERLRELAVDPLSVGRVIVASWEPNEGRVLQAIRELGLEQQIIFNKGAVMVLPPGINKESGLRAALAALELSPHNCVAIGDAENDQAMLQLSGLPVAVANALPSVQETASLVTDGARGAGVAELIDRLIATDLAEIDAASPRQRVALARQGEDVLWLVPARQSVLLAGASGGGKSTLSTGLMERLHAERFQYCVIDPEGDYEGTEEAIGIGSAAQSPTVDGVMELLRKTGNNVVVNLLGLKLADRPGFLAALLPELLGLRARTGRPHFVLIDEAHHMLPASWDPGGAALPAELKGFLFITVHPDRLAARVLDCVDRIMVVGAEPCSALRAFCEARGLPAPNGDMSLEQGEALTLTPDAPRPAPVTVIPGSGQRRRHLRKYSEGRLGEDKSFFFRGADERLNLRAHNLSLFVELADGVDKATWQWHRERGDYSHWIADSIKDPELAEEAAAIEHGDLPPDAARQKLREAIERRYTLPA
ncbi:MAG: HAD-IIB family hydrolase [Acidisphaera sp.]|nr:HAD-IIB family hydrolase [Acidisphaera sp.]